MELECEGFICHEELEKRKLRGTLDLRLHSPYTRLNKNTNYYMTNNSLPHGMTFMAFNERNIGDNFVRREEITLMNTDRKKD